MERFTGLIGIVVLLAIAFAMSNNRKKLNWRLIIWGLSLQLLFALFILKTPIGQPFFGAVDLVVKKLLSFSDAGSDFLFKSFGAGVVEAPLMNFAFRVLPTIIFFSSLMAILYYFGIMQRIVKAIAWVMERTLKNQWRRNSKRICKYFCGANRSSFNDKTICKRINPI